MTTDALPVPLTLTPEEFFDWEERQEEKHEYIHGEVFSMAGGTRVHAVIIGNLHHLLRLALAGRDCQVYTEAMRVQMAEGRRYTYPDLSVVCGEERFADARETTLTNPAVLVEVLSPGTERADRGEKLVGYRAIPSVREVVLVSTERRAVEVVRRDGPGRWTVEETTQGAARLESLRVDVPLEALYAGTDVEA